MVVDAKVATTNMVTHEMTELVNSDGKVIFDFMRNLSLDSTLEEQGDSGGK
jgi:hypothetical protein